VALLWYCCGIAVVSLWGPSELELAQALVIKFTGRWNEIVDNEGMVFEGEEEEEEEEEEIDDDELLSAIEAMAPLDTYHGGSDDENLFN